MNPKLPALKRYCDSVADLRRPEQILHAVSGFARVTGGACSAVDVLKTGSGNCLGLAALATSILLAMPGVSDEQAWVTVLTREGQLNCHAVALYTPEAGKWIAIDPANEMPAVILPTRPDPSLAGVNWATYGFPSGVETRLLFNHRTIRFPDRSWAGSGRL